MRTSRLLLLIPVTLLLGGCSNKPAYICDITPSQVIIFTEYIQSSGHICGLINNETKCFDRGLCEIIK